MMAPSATEWEWEIYVHLLCSSHHHHHHHHDHDDRRFIIIMIMIIITTNKRCHQHHVQRRERDRDMFDSHAALCLALTHTLRWLWGDDDDKGDNGMKLRHHNLMGIPLIICISKLNLRLADSCFWWLRSAHWATWLCLVCFACSLNLQLFEEGNFNRGLCYALS